MWQPTPKEPKNHPLVRADGTPSRMYNVVFKHCISGQLRSANVLAFSAPHAANLLHQYGATWELVSLTRNQPLVPPSNIVPMYSNSRTNVRWDGKTSEVYTAIFQNLETRQLYSFDRAAFSLIHAINMLHGQNSNWELVGVVCKNLTSSPFEYLGA